MMRRVSSHAFLLHESCSHEVTHRRMLESLTTDHVTAGRIGPERSRGMSEGVPSSAPVTRMLLDWSDGDERARDEMLPLVYDELRRLAASYLAGERRSHTLEPTALVHEAQLSAQKMSLDYPLCASQAAFSIVT